MSKYFDAFPTIEYGQKIAKNILARPSVLLPVFNNPNSFYDYVIKDDMRPDQVAYYYYDDPSLVWLIFLVNKIVDPYHDWPLTEKQLDEYVNKKYPTDPVLYYKHKTTGAEITTDTYDLNAQFGKIIAGQYTAVRAVAKAREENEAKRKIKLLDKRFASKAKTELKRVMNV